MRSLLCTLLLLAACHPAEPVIAGVNTAFGYRVISFADDCPTNILTDDRTICVRLDWGRLKPRQLGHTERPPASRYPWTITLSEDIRDNPDLIRAALAHEIGHVLGLPDDPVSGRLMSSRLTEHADQLVGDLPRLVAEHNSLMGKR